MIETARLVMRRFQEKDLDPVADSLADPRVADWLAGPITRDQCADRILAWTAELDERGYGRLAVERKADGAVIGVVGLHALDEAYDDTPLAGATEIGWHLAFAAWGQGFATEAAKAVSKDGLGRVGLSEIVAFTASSNLRSRAVMERSGFSRRADRDFNHPRLSLEHALSRHVVYALSKGSN